MADMRRKTAMKRKVDRLEYSSDTFDRLVDALRESKDKRLPQVLSLIQSNASVEELHNYLEANFTRAEMDKTAELQDLQHHLRRSSDEPEEEDPPVSRPPRRMLDVRRLADSPIYRVPAKPWTTVTDDDDLVSHLVSLFFTWSFPYFCWIDRDAIISAMQSGDLSNPHCSPFLVNAILSEASVCHIPMSVLHASREVLTWLLLFSTIPTTPRCILSQTIHYHEVTNFTTRHVGC
jgi:hypothetical protein